MAQAQVPGTFQGRAGEAQLRLACRCGQDLDMAGADPQAETAAERLDGGLLGSPAPGHEGGAQFRADLLLGRCEDSVRKTRAMTLQGPLHAPYVGQIHPQSHQHVRPRS